MKVIAHSVTSSARRKAVKPLEAAFVSYRGVGVYAAFNTVLLSRRFASTAAKTSQPPPVLGSLE
jgi:hypothetical protein